MRPEDREWITYLIEMLLVHKGKFANYEGKECLVDGSQMVRFFDSVVCSLKLILKENE